VLLKEEVPTASLGQMGRLGWTIWTASQTFTQHADDLLLDPVLHASHQSSADSQHHPSAVA
jgi:predicted component of type VI protein secretion system